MIKSQRKVKNSGFSLSSNLSNEPLLIFCNTSREQNGVVFESMRNAQDYTGLVKKHFSFKNTGFNANTVDLGEVLHLRLILKKFFNNIITSKKIKKSDLKDINKFVSDSSLVFDAALAIDVVAVASKSYLKPIIVEMIKFLPKLDLKRLKKCQNKNCTHLFLDRSKNNSRVWCSMSSCGNVMKARNFYQRSKSIKN